MVIAIIAGVYLVVCAAAFLMQRQLIYFPTRHIVTTPAKAGLQYEELVMTSPDGVKFIVWHMPADSARIIVIYFHGNAENISNPIDTYLQLHELGASIFAFEYRGYANCTGSPSEEGIAIDLQTFADYLKRSLPDDAKVVVLGRSLGGAVAAKFSAIADVDGAIYESTFNKMIDVAKSAFPYLPISLLLRERYDSEEAISVFTKPVLVIHSPEDEVIPFESGRRLYDVIKSEKTFVEIKGSHNGGVLESADILRTAYGDFFEKVIRSQN